jgi:hypothetical protein
MEGKKSMKLVINLNSAYTVHIDLFSMTQLRIRIYRQLNRGIVEYCNVLIITTLT